MRHGQTMWSETGQYTGRTNIPLTAGGEQQAVAAGQRLRAFGARIKSENVYVSPLRRAQKTAKLAGFSSFVVDNNLAEFDYGPAEGRTRAQIAAALGADTWNIWDIGPLNLPEELQGTRVEKIDNFGDIEVVAGVGESAHEAAVRVSELIDKVMPKLMAGEDVLCVAHAHILRILTTQWLDLLPEHARNFRLDTAHFCVLDWHHEDRVVAYWNL